MFCGDYEKAKRELIDLVGRAVLRGWVMDRPQQSDPWVGTSGLKARASISQKVENAVLQILSDFDQLPVDGWMFVEKRYQVRVPIDKILTPTLAEISTLWEDPTVYAKRKLKSIQVALVRDLEALDASWRSDHGTATSCQEQRSQRTRATTR